MAERLSIRLRGHRTEEGVSRPLWLWLPHQSGRKAGAQKNTSEIEMRGREMRLKAAAAAAAAAEERRWEDDGGGEMVEEGGREVVKWEEILPRVSMRVLLVESDDSTRQIISALLRNCGYRVCAVSDGLKAWARLKEKSHGIDLVLTEVDLPSVSGFALLSMTMDQNTCKDVPVIMMSSHDSISTVFKCVMKGAADYLVKPVRKNELRNLRQHVWRRRIGRIHEHQDEDLAKTKLDGKSQEHGDCMKENQECSVKGSDAQSSCTKSDMEVESTYPHMRDNKQPDIHFTGATVMQTNDNIEAEDKFTMAGRKVIHNPFNRACNLNEVSSQQVRTCDVAEGMNKDKPCKEVVDLIGAIDNQPRYTSVQRHASTIPDASEALHNEKGVKYESRSANLELSLRRYQQSTCDKSESDQSIMLNHSNSSAFSVYNSRIAVPTSSATMVSDGGQKEHSTASDAPCCNDSALEMHAEDNSLVGHEVGQEGSAVHCSPVRVIPFPAPFRGMPYDSWSAGYGRISEPLYYPQTAHPFWNAVPPLWHEAIHTKSPVQSCSKDLIHLESHQQRSQTHKSLIQHPERKNDQDNVQNDEQRHVSSVIGENGCSSISNVTSSHLNINGFGSLRVQSEGNLAADSISDANTVSGHVEGQFSLEGVKPFLCLSQREAALNKFRLKRKERCYEKKVRYQSRKRLAEQRPRVKGQFIRQVLPDS